MQAYESLNFLEEDGLFSEDELLVRDSIRNFVDKEVLPTLQKANREEKSPPHLDLPLKLVP